MGRHDKACAHCELADEREPRRSTTCGALGRRSGSHRPWFPDGGSNSSHPAGSRPDRADAGRCWVRHQVGRCRPSPQDRYSPTRDITDEAGSIRPVASEPLDARAGDAAGGIRPEQPIGPLSARRSAGPGGTEPTPCWPTTELGVAGLALTRPSGALRPGRLHEVRVRRTRLVRAAIRCLSTTARRIRVRGTEQCELTARGPGTLQPPHTGLPDTP